MKKVAVFLLVSALIFSLGACGLRDGDVKGKVEEIPSSSQTETKAEEPVFALGQTNGNVYTSAFLGMTGTFDSAWHVYNEAEIEELNRQVIGNASPDMKKEMENADFFYDLMAQNETTGATLNIVLEKVSALQLSVVSPKAALESSKDSVKTELAGQGYTDLTQTMTKRNYLGNSEDCLLTEGTVNDVRVYMAQVAVKKGNYFMVISVGTLFEDQTQSLLDLFTKI